MTRSAHRTLEDRRDPDADSLVEVKLDLRGGSAPADHRYCLYSALKRRCCADLTERGWQIRTITDGTERGEIIDLDRADPAVKIRLPKQDIRHLLDLCEAPIELGSHVLIVDDTVVSEITPSNCIKSDLVVVCNGNRAPQGHWPADLGAAVGARLGAWFGRSDFGVQFGERDSFQINGATYYGQPCKIAGLRDDESLFVQRHGVGGKQAMGCGTFWPAPDGF